MKKKLFVLMALMASMSVGAETFDLWVAGTQVTSENRKDVLGDGSVKYYDNGSNELGIKNSTIKGGVNPAIKSRLDFIHIYIEGDVTLEGSVGLDVTGDVQIGHTVEYNENLTINATQTGILLTAGKLTLPWSLKSFKVKGQEYGLLGVDNAILSYPFVHNEGDFWPETTFQGINKAAIAGLKTSSGDALDISYIGMVEPANAALIGGNVVDGDNRIVNGDAVVRFAPTEFYGIEVGGVWVTSANASKIRSDATIGDMTYNSTTRVLTLDNAEIFTTCACVKIISAENNNVNIAVKGDCSLVSTENQGLVCGKDCRIYGLDKSSELTLRSNSSIPTMLLSASSTIDNLTLTALSNGSAPAIKGEENAKLIIGSYVDLTATANVSGTPAISMPLKELGSAVITYPTGATWPDGSKEVLDANGNVAGKVVMHSEENGAVDNILIESSPITDVFSIDGRKLAAPIRGFNIVRRADGSCSKIFVK